MANREQYNSSGCLDMTAYLALRNIEREENAELYRREREKEKRRVRLERRRQDKKSRSR